MSSNLASSSSQNPGIFADILKFAVCSAAGQAFIFYMISSFDPLVCTTVTTTRKVFSVLLSIFAKGHKLDMQGWAGITTAGAGILGELEHKFSESRQKVVSGDVRHVNLHSGPPVQEVQCSSTKP